MLNQFSNKRKDGFSHILESAVTNFSDKGFTVLGQNYDEIISDNTLFQEYATMLAEGLDAEQSEVMEGLMNNTRIGLLTESMAGTTPISSLSLPMLRKSYPRFVMPHVIPTEAATKEKFTKMFYKPYILRNGTKISLPEEFYKETHEYHMRLPLRQDLFAADGSNFDLFLGVANTSVLNGDSVDTDVSLLKVVMTLKDASNADVDTEVTSVGNLRMDTRTNILSGTVTAKADGSTTEVSDTVFVKVDRETGLVQATSLVGKIKQVALKSFASSEMNNHTEEVGFDIKQSEVNIPTAAHIAAPLSNEYLTSLLTMFNIDGVEKVVDIMSTTMANKVDKEGLQFITESKRADGVWDRVFNARPYAQYMLSPTEWRKEIRTALDNMAQNMVNDLMIGTDGHFCIVGNPIDVALIPDQKWVFNGREDEAGGVKVDYSILSATSAFAYKIISSPAITKGKLRMVYIPGNEDALTYVFYPFSFFMQTANGYVNPRTPNVPSIVASRRYVYEKFTPSAYCELTITNNTGIFQ